MLKSRTTFYSLLDAIILSVISLDVYLNNGNHLVPGSPLPIMQTAPALISVPHFCSCF